MGEHEFEADGPPDVVASQLAIWKDLIGSVGAGPTASPAASESRGQSSGISKDDARTQPLQDDGAARIFQADDRSDLVTLRVHPRGDQRESEALLLLVLGFKLLRNVEDVLVTKLKESVRVSGLSIDRIDRAAEPSLNGRLMLKSGRGKGGRYRLTHTGLEMARRIANEIASTMA